MRLKDKTAIVTGGGGDIGLGIARCFAREGARLLIVDLNGEAAGRAAKAVDDSGETAFPLAADLTREEDAALAVRTAVEKLGRVDILVNSHGRASRELGNPIDGLSLAEWNGVMAVNLTSVFLMCRAVAAHMRERRSGKIVNIASMAGRRANENVPHSCVSKAGVISFTQSLAREMAPFDVNVNAINPGLIWTPIWEKGHGVLIGEAKGGNGGAPSSREVFDDFVKAAVPLKREQTPEDVGQLAVYLASEESRNVTGQAMMLAGGAWMA